MRDFIDQIFEQAGQAAHGSPPRDTCPTDEAFAGYVAARLPSAESASIELHTLACADCHELLKAVVDMGSGALQSSPSTHGARLAASSGSASIPTVTIVGRLLRGGLQLVNHLELAFRTLSDGPLTPALGVLRGGEPAAEPATTEWVCVRGPGSGLDEFELQVQANGTARLVVRCDRMPALDTGEIASIVLDVEGSAREKRPFSGEAVSFAPLGLGHYRVRLIARAPGAGPRPIAQASIEFVN